MPPRSLERDRMDGALRVVQRVSRTMSPTTTPSGAFRSRRPALFEKICLEGFQSGLSWLTILRKRENFRRGFASFEIERVARFTARDVDPPARAMPASSAIAARSRARSTTRSRCEELIEEFGSLSNYVWRFEPPKSRPKKLTWDVLKAMPTTPGVDCAVERSPQAAAGRSSARRPCMRSCRRWDWSTITCTAAVTGSQSPVASASSQCQ